MSSLLNLPDDLFANNILKYLCASDLCRLEAVCQRFHRKDDAKDNVVESEFQARDREFTLSQQYHPKSPIASMFDCRRRVFWFERCSAFAWEAVREVQKHEECSTSCHEHHPCRCPDLYSNLPRLANGLRDGTIYLFFAQFTRHDKLLWQGFLGDYNQESDITANPMDDLLRNADGEVNDINEVLGAEAAAEWIDVKLSMVDDADVQFHLDTSYVTNLKREDADMGRDLHVTLVSLIYSQDEPETLPELRLHYSFRKFILYCGRRALDDETPSFDLLWGQCGKNGDDAAPILIWKSNSCLHSFSLLYAYDRSDEYMYDCGCDCDSYYDSEEERRHEEERQRNLVEEYYSLL